MNIAENMTLIMNAKGISFRALEERTGITSTRLHRIASNKHMSLNDCMDALCMIAEALDTTLLQLIGLSANHYSDDESFRELQEALNELDEMRKMNLEAYFAFGFDLKKLTGEEIIQRAQSVKKVRNHIKELK